MSNFPLTPDIPLISTDVNNRRLSHSNSILDLFYIDQSDMLTNIDIDYILDCNINDEIITPLEIENNNEYNILSSPSYIQINNTLNNEHFNNYSSLVDKDIIDIVKDENYENNHTKNISIFYSIWNLSNDIIANSAISLPYSV